MLFSSRNYAIGMAHYQIAGGTKSLIGLAVAYVCGAATILGIVLYNTESFAVPRVMVAMFTLFLVIEAFMVVLLGSFRIGGCIRADITTNMIESHRQMPIPAWRAVAGYLLGTTAHVLILTLLNVILLAILGKAARLSFDNFVMSQIVLVAFAFFIWSFAAMNSFMFRQIAPLMVLGAMFGGVSSIFLRNFGILPGISLLISPFLGESIFNLSGGVISLRSAYPIALAAQAAFAALFFVGACRRYRGTFLTTFNVPQALGLVTVWSLLSVASIRIWPSISVTIMFRALGPQPEVHTQIIASLFVAALLMIVPLHALSAWEHHHPVNAQTRLLALSTTVLTGMLILPAGEFEGYLWLMSLVVISAHVATIYAALRAFRIFTPMTVIVLMAAVLLTLWLLPLVAEGLLSTFAVPADAPALPSAPFAFVGSLSPLGLLSKLWAHPETTPLPYGGLFLQLTSPVLLWRLGSFLAKRNRKPAF